ncbi:hypothetical protein DWG18_02790 [Lysobacter sp. TY2-98]|uniref:hypothetical protein n=1 Tax=Lysobacter sp. TY2-98 TaxID=2290922 RepID=UPI000E1FDDC5|nr:hypothetical protein [Lysobacter sp. TY2-98]AXK71318.1 hypothetical protein DWG18_02790 [Lysobacter sp. TY2-98]
MKVPMSVLTIALGLGLTLPASPDVQAAYTGIQRCRAPDGTAVYTDKPCAMFGAHPEAMSQDLGMRLMSEASREPEAYADVNQSNAIAPSANTGRRSLADGCARTPTQLAMDIQGSLAMRDVNRLAESWQWAGMTKQQALPVMKHLEQLTQERVMSTQYFDAQIGFGLQLASNDRDTGDGRAGILQVSLVGKSAPQMLELNVERYAGCYFVKF